MVGSVVILTSSFLGTPSPCFAYVYGDYTIDGERGYELYAFYKDKDKDYKDKDLSGFSKQEIKDYTISYIDDSFEFKNILNLLRIYESEGNRNNMIHSHSLLLINILNYLNDERLISYMRDYNIDQII